MHTVTSTVNSKNFVIRQYKRGSDLSVFFFLPFMLGRSTFLRFEWNVFHKKCKEYIQILFAYSMAAGCVCAITLLLRRVSGIILLPVGSHLFFFGYAIYTECVSLVITLIAKRNWKKSYTYSNKYTRTTSRSPKMFRFPSELTADLK